MTVWTDNDENDTMVSNENDANDIETMIMISRTNDGDDIRGNYYDIKRQWLSWYNRYCWQWYNL